MSAASRLTGCPSCGAKITSDARFCGGCGAAIASTEPTSGGSGLESADAAGREIAGRYRVLAKLGEGGMGAVYRAEQISLKRVVALKLLKPELSADPGLVRRFNAEAEMAARLNHPNTVTLYDFGQDADGSLFIAMELIEGRSLREVMHHEGPLSVPRAVAIAAQVCSSLADAHARGIVHRDLKPDNVMLSARGRESDVVRVLDFGIAKLRDAQGDITAMPMTQAGDLLGTPQYMAPEQIRGERVDPRTDVYALGAMLYEMVTGRLPFEAPTLMAILSKHLTEMPVPPCERRADLAIPRAISDLVIACLAKEPERRPASMDQLAGSLEPLATSPAARAAAAPRPAPGPAPSVVSAPPGVPRRLATPTPGSTPRLQPAPMTPSPAMAAAPAAAAPPAAHGPPAPMPARGPGTPPPSYSAPGPATPPPSYSAPGPATPPPYAPSSHGAAANFPNRGRAAWPWALVAVGVIGAAGLAAFFALRTGGDSAAREDPEPVARASSDRSSDSSDVPSLADFDVKAGSSPEAAAPAAPAQEPPSAAHRHDASFFGAPHADAVWHHPSLPVHVHYPEGFEIGADGNAWGLSGQWKGQRMQIMVVAANVGFEQPPAAQRAMVINLVSQAGALITSESQRVVRGKSRYTGIYELDAGEKGEVIVFSEGPLLVLVGVASPTAAFAAHSDFRRAFFETAIAVGR
jgi:serine/threonine-protein kinase